MNKEVFIIASEEVFKLIPSEIRHKFKYIEFKEENEYEDNKTDEVYKQLYKAKKKANKEVSEYLFKKRNNML